MSLPCATAGSVSPVGTPTGSPIDGGTVLVTGASSGIGRELALQLAARAKTLVLLARRAGLLEVLRSELVARHQGLRVITFPVDLSDEHDRERMVAEVTEQTAPVDVLVNNAGVGDQTCSTGLTGAAPSRSCTRTCSPSST
jgi:short-subunit dehydrogenase